MILDMLSCVRDTLGRPVWQGLCGIANLHMASQVQQSSADAAILGPASPPDAQQAFVSGSEHAQALPMHHPHGSAAPTHLSQPAGHVPLQPSTQIPLRPPVAISDMHLAHDQQLTGSLSPGQVPRPVPRKTVPLHKGVGLVRLCIPDATPHDPDKLQQTAIRHDGVLPLLAKYSAWPFTCLWPESPPSQPPPLPSRSPTVSPRPPSMPAAVYEPRLRAEDTPAARSLSTNGPSHHTQQEQRAVAGNPEAAAASAALPGPPVVRPAHRASARQAPKHFIDPSLSQSAPSGRFEPAVKRHRAAPAMPPDDGRPAAQLARSR